MEDRVFDLNFTPKYWSGSSKFEVKLQFVCLLLLVHMALTTRPEKEVQMHIARICSLPPLCVKTKNTAKEHFVGVFSIMLAGMLLSHPTAYIVPQFLQQYAVARRVEEEDMPNFVYADYL